MGLADFLMQAYLNDVERRAEFGPQVPKSMLERFMAERVKRLTTPRVAPWDVPEPPAPPAAPSGPVMVAGFAR